MSQPNYCQSGTTLRVVTQNQTELHDSESRATLNHDSESRATVEELTSRPSGRTKHRDWTIVVAASLNGVIGRGDTLPWHLRSDLQRFKRLTMGQTLLMGRKTYQSIGRPLPGRQTIVLSRKGAGLFAAHRRSTLRVEFHASPEIRPATELETELEPSRENSSEHHDSESRATLPTLPTETRPVHVSVAADLEEVAGLIEAGRRLMVVGGAEVYRSALDYCSTICLTRVLADIEGDTFFPEVDWSQWRLESVESVDSGTRDDWPTEFQIWTRVEPRP